MQESELEKHKEKLRCSFCRNSMLQSEKVNITKNEGEFVSIMCGDCDKRFKDNPQLGPKFLICLCADEPRELDLSMSKEELEIIKKEMSEHKDKKKEGFKTEPLGAEKIPNKEVARNEVSTLQAKKDRNIST